MITLATSSCSPQAEEETLRSWDAQEMKPTRADGHAAWMFFRLDSTSRFI